MTGVPWMPHLSVLIRSYLGIREFSNSPKGYALCSQWKIWRTLVFLIQKQQYFRGKSSSWILLWIWNRLPYVKYMNKFCYTMSRTRKMFLQSCDNIFIKYMSWHLRRLGCKCWNEHLSSQLWSGSKLSLNISLYIMNITKHFSAQICSGEHSFFPKVSHTSKKKKVNHMLLRRLFLK